MKFTRTKNTLIASSFGLAFVAAIAAYTGLSQADAPGWSEDDTALQSSISTNDLRQFLDLMDHSPDLHLNSSRTTMSPLLLAVMNGHLPMITRLIRDPRVNVNQGNSAGYTPLHLAIEQNNPAVVALLLTSPRINPNQGNRYSWTPLMLGLIPDAWTGNLGRRGEALQILLQDRRVNVNQQDRFGHSALQYVVKINHRERRLILNSLLARSDIVIEPRDNIGETPLHTAVRSQNFYATRALLQAGARAHSKATPHDQSPSELAEFYLQHQAPTDEERQHAQRIVDLLRAAAR